MSRAAINEARRAARIRRVVEEVMTRRAGGDAVTDVEVACAYPDLMPDLQAELALLSMLERARRSGTSRAPTYDGPIQPLGENAFEGFVVHRESHRGGQGVVYEATQKSTGRRVAIKVMREGLFSGDRDAARFEREVRILGQLEHPGVVGILASGIRAGHFYYVMDFVQGVPLDEHARAIGRAPRKVLELFAQVCDAVNAAHVRGVIHRDLKPGNILVDDQGRPHILDFGLARVAAEAEQGPRLTATGQFVGSLPWSSPEQAAGDPGKMDLRTDVYSLGVILYQALSGRFPYLVEGGPRDVLNSILNTAPGRIRSSVGGVDAGLEAIVLKCLSKERERRYPIAGELGADVRRWLNGRPVLAHPPSLGYQARVFARRNRALVLGAAAVLGALLLGLVGTTTGLIEASSAHRAAVHERDAARAAEGLAETRRAEAERHAYSASIAAADSALRAEDAAGAATRLAAAPERLRDWEWRYLTGRTDRSAAMLPLGPLQGASVSHDGNRLAVMGHDGALRVLDVATLTTQWEAAVPDSVRGGGDPSVACWSRDGTMVATTHGGNILIWRVGTEAPIAELTFPTSWWGRPLGTFRPDGGALAVCGRNGRMLVWEVPSGRLIREFPGSSRYAGLDYSPDGAVLAVCTTDGIERYDGRTLERLDGPGPGPAPVGQSTPLRFSPDGATLVSVKGTDLVVFRASDLSVAAVLRGHTQRPEGWGFSADGRLLASTGWDRTVRVWDLATARQERLYWGHADRAMGVEFVAGGTRMASWGSDGTVRFWDLASVFDPPTLPLGVSVDGLSFLRGGERVLAAGRGRAVLWNPDQPVPQALPAPIVISPRHTTAAISDGSTLLAVPTEDGRLQLWDDGRVVWAIQSPTPTIDSLAFSPDGRRLALNSSADGTWTLDAGAGSVLWSAPRDSGDTFELKFSPDSSAVAVASVGRLRLYDAASGRTVDDLVDPADPAAGATCVAFSPDGTMLAAGADNGSARLWDLRARRIVRRLTGMRPVVWSVAFNPSGTRLATGSQDRMARIWDPGSGDELLVLRGHTGSVTALAWSPDGNTLATGSYDGTVRRWTAPFPATSPGLPGTR